MEIEITKKMENRAFDRVEVTFRIRHDGPTPRREEVAEALAALLSAKREGLVIDHMNTEFGRSLTNGYAKLYPSKEKAQAVEPEHLLKRNRMDRPPKKGQAKKEGS